MKSFQDRLFKDFDVEKRKTKDGKIKNVYVYKGLYVFWDLPQEMLARYKRLYLCAGILMGVLLAFASLLRLPLNASKYAGGVTLLAWVAYMVLVMGLFSFIRAKHNMYLRDCNQMRTMILWSSMLFFLLETAYVILGIVYLIQHGGNVTSVVALLAGALAGALSLVIFLAQNKLNYREISGKKLIDGHFL